MMDHAVTVFAVLLPILQWDHLTTRAMVVDLIGACGMLLAAIFLMRPHAFRRGRTARRPARQA
jgi:hypothetical protein